MRYLRLFEEWNSIGGLESSGKIEIPEIYQDILESEKSKTSEESYDIWAKWYSLINMTASELKRFMDSEQGKDAGLSAPEAKKQGISRGRISAGWLLKMIPTGRSWESALENWTPAMWKWARKQVSFNSRMLGNKPEKSNPYVDENGDMTRWLKSLLIWGHDPRKAKRKSPKLHK